MTKRIIALIGAVSLAFSLCACGGGVKKSGITGAEAQEEFWNLDLDASAEKLNEFRAQTPEEVASIWRQGKMQGNGALIYALYNDDLKSIFLEQMKNNGSWNMYYASTPPQDVTLVELERNKKENEYIYSVDTTEADGQFHSQQIVIQLVDGAYRVATETADYETDPEIYGETYLRDFGGEQFTEAGT